MNNGAPQISGIFSRLHAALKNPKVDKVTKIRKKRTTKKRKCIIL